jgi:hypothetical protein
MQPSETIRAGRCVLTPPRRPHVSTPAYGESATSVGTDFYRRLLFIIDGLPAVGAACSHPCVGEVGHAGVPVRRGKLAGVFEDLGECW